MRKQGLDKKTFNLILGGVGAVVVLVVLFGVLDVKLPSFSWPFGKKEVVAQGPLYPIHDEATFASLTQNYHIEPPQAPSLTFDISLPKEWTIENVATDTSEAFSKQIIGEVALLRSPYIGTNRPELRVQTTTLRHDIEAATWLEHYILTNSYIPQGEVTAAGLIRATGAFSYISPEGKPMLVQAAVQFNGREAVLARFEMPLSFQEALGFMQKRAIESFKLTAADEKTVEEQKSFTLAELIKFSYPASWELAPPNLRDIDRLSIQLFNKNSAGAFQGYIQMFVIRRKGETSLEKEAARLRDYIINTVRLNIDKMGDQRPLPALSRFAFNRIETYSSTSTANPNTPAQELRLITLGNAEHYIFIMMLSPQSSVDLYNWGRNKRALDLIAASLQ